VKRFALRSRSVPGRTCGFTLIELAIATSILMIGIVSVLSASSQMHSLRQVNRERTLAQNAVRSISERIHAASQGFSDDPTTWCDELLALYGPGGSLGDGFEVLGLALPEGEDFVGHIAIHTDERLTDAEIGRDLGMPRDLNGDGDATDADIRNSARILPVTITLRWIGESGQQVLRHGFYVMGY